MNNVNFSNKWRPKNFKDLVGQKYVIKAISNSFKLNRIHQVWLFYGTRGVGKTTIARILAKCLNCKKKITESPCQKCSSCKEISKNCSPDLIEIDAASKTRIEDTKILLKGIKYFPMKERFKIYIIDEIHMLSKYSFNALLKTLEEPPKYIKFILATTEIKKIPDTILSRCLIFNLKKLSKKDIKNRIKFILKNENIKFENSSLKLIAKISQGSLRDAINLTEQSIDLCKKNIKTKKIIKMLGYFCKKDIFLLFKYILIKNPKKTILLTNKFYSLGVNPDLIFVELIKLFYYVYLIKSLSLKYKKKKYSYLKKEILKKISNELKYSDIKKYYNELIKGRKNLSYAPSKKIGLEISLLYSFSIKTLYNVKNIIKIFKNF